MLVQHLCYSCRSCCRGKDLKVSFKLERILFVGKVKKSGQGISIWIDRSSTEKGRAVCRAGPGEGSRAAPRGSSCSSSPGTGREAPRREQLHKGREISASWKTKRKKGAGRGGIGIQTTAPARAQQEPHKETPAVLSPDGVSRTAPGSLMPRKEAQQ